MRAPAPGSVDAMNPIQALRTKGWARTVLIRRLIAAVLVAVATFLALRPEATTDAPMLVTATDLSPGTVLSTKDVKLVRAPPHVIPAAALTDPGQASGQLLTGAAAAGEPITRKRLLGKENTHLTTGLGDASAVPIRLPDPAIADLLMPGSHVDIIGPDRTILASAATVLTVRPSTDAQTHLAVIALPHDEAATVAAAALTQDLAITLR
jgi:Flp pilus assembly protein CpaB